ncbi:MAG: hypothetical protein CL902_03310 [Dehalococcoidia bacterium]|nr:hypothetical protein [Dehalococcoidia bacterium]
MIALARKYRGIAAYRRTYERGGDTYWANDLTGSYLHELRVDGCGVFWPCCSDGSGGVDTSDRFGDNDATFTTTSGNLTQEFKDGPLLDTGRDEDSLYRVNYDAGNRDGVYLSIDDDDDYLCDTYIKGPAYTSNMAGGITGYPYTLETWFSPYQDGLTTGIHWILAHQDTLGGTNDYVVVKAEFMQAAQGPPPEYTAPYTVLVCSGGSETEYVVPSCQVPWASWPWQNLSGLWSHVVLVVESDGFRLYVNGQLLLDESVSMPSFPIRGYRLSAGASIDDSSVGADVVDHVANMNVWGIAAYPNTLDDQQVVRHYIAGTRCLDLKLQSGDDGGNVTRTLTTSKCRSIGEPHADCVIWPYQHNATGTSVWYGLEAKDDVYGSSAAHYPTNGVFHWLSNLHEGMGIISSIQPHNLPATLIHFWREDTDDWTLHGSGCSHPSLPADAGANVYLDAGGNINSHYGFVDTATDAHRNRLGSDGPIVEWASTTPRKSRHYTVCHWQSWNTSSEHEHDGIEATGLMINGKEMLYTPASGGETLEVACYHNTRAVGISRAGHVMGQATGGDFDLGMSWSNHGDVASSGSGDDLVPGAWHFEGRMGPTVIFAGYNNPYIMRRMNRAIKGHRGLRTRPLTNMCNRHVLLIHEGRQGLSSR